MRMINNENIKTQHWTLIRRRKTVELPINGLLADGDEEEKKWPHVLSGWYWSYYST